MPRELNFNLGKTNPPIAEQGGNLGSYKGVAAGKKGKEPDTFEALSRSSKSEKEAVLSKIYRDLFRDGMQQSQEGYLRMFNCYSGEDAEFKQDMERFFGKRDVIYNGMDLNSITKSIANKLIQPFLSKDDVLAVSPMTIDVETADRISELLNRQMINEQFIEESYKVIKDGLIYGISFMSVGWKTSQLRVQKRILKSKESDSLFDVADVEVDTYAEFEDITVEEPDFKAESVGHVYYPDARRWRDIPYVIRKEVISKRMANERYGVDFEELERNRKPSQYDTEYDRLAINIPGTDVQRGKAASDLVDILHFYFSDGSYFVCHMDNNTIELLYEGTSPVPGLPIPIIPFIPDPITNRIQGESMVMVAMGEQRKLTELDNLMMRTVRNMANAPIAYTPDSGLNINEYMSRTPGTPIQVHMIDGIKKIDVDGFNAAFIQLKEHYTGKLTSLSGQSDFSMGNIGRSARLSGVDSLVGLAMSRMSIALSQFNSFILQVADALILLNRAFLPLEYGKISTSLYTKKGTELLEIPYPLTVKIRTNLSGSSDKSITLGALREAIQLGFQLNMIEPGVVDINSLAQRFFAEAGIRDIGRYFTKSPFTAEERSTMHMIDKVIASNMRPGGMPLQPVDEQQMGGGGLDPTGQNMAMPSIQEQTNQSF